MMDQDLLYLQSTITLTITNLEIWKMEMNKTFWRQKQKNKIDITR
jgi:hypothetical protein